MYFYSMSQRIIWISKQPTGSRAIYEEPVRPCCSSATIARFWLSDADSRAQPQPALSGRRALIIDGPTIFVTQPIALALLVLSLLSLALPLVGRARRARRDAAGRPVADEAARTR